MALKVCLIASGRSGFLDHTYITSFGEKFLKKFLLVLVACFCDQLLFIGLLVRVEFCSEIPKGAVPSMWQMVTP